MLDALSDSFRRERRANADRIEPSRWRNEPSLDRLLPGAVLVAPGGPAWRLLGLSAPSGSWWLSILSAPFALDAVSDWSWQAAGKSGPTPAASALVELSSSCQLLGAIRRPEVGPL